MKSLGTTVFTPELVSGKEMKESLKTGTTTIGIICKDCVVLAADKRATTGTLIAYKRMVKVLPVTEHIGVTTAGSVSDLQLLYKYLSAELKLKGIRRGREATVREAANLLGQWVYNLIRASAGVAHFVVGGFADGPEVYDVYPDGSVTQHDDYVVSGSGSVFALGVLENKYKKDLSQAEGVDLVVEALTAAMARDSASGNGIDVVAIGKDGIQKVISKLVKTGFNQ